MKYELARIEHALVEAAGPIPDLGSVRWEAYRSEHLNGVPLLASAAAALPVASAAAEVLVHMAARIEPFTMPPPLADALHEVRNMSAKRLAAEVANVAAHGEADPGVRFFAWHAIRHVIEPVLEAYRLWRDDDQWGLPDCPTCGAVPLLAQLIPAGLGRQRLLSCGCCTTRWTYRRIGCLTCGNEDPQKLQILEPEGEDLRLDVCVQCQSYVKTYVGSGAEEVALADWTSLHLDVLARSRGLKRLGDSLYAV